MNEIKFDTKKVVNKFEKPFEAFLKYIGYINGNIDMSLYSNNNFFNLKKYSKNINTFDRLKALRSRFYSLLILCEYFTKKIELKYHGELELKEEFTDYIFTSQLTDGFRSVLDIYAIVVMFFYTNEVDDINFSWKKFIKPIRKFSEPIYEFSNDLYKKYNNSTTKEIRDRDRHLGFNEIDWKPEIVNNVVISSKFTKKEYPELTCVVSDTFELIYDFISLFDHSILEFCK